MIEIRNLRKTYTLNGVDKVVADNVNFTFPARVSVGLLGRNGAGKSTLLRMLAGTMSPDSGEIIRKGTVSWPVGFAGSFHGDMTGAQNVKFVARIYGVDTDEMVAFVEEFSGLGAHFYLPTRTYSSGMKSRLAFGVSMAIRFDTYLIDEVTSVGDTAFRIRSSELLRHRLKDSAAIIVSHSAGLLRELCTAGVVLENGKLLFYPKIEQAIQYHEGRMIAGSAKRT
jgi:capsular polysaccharide transport system ATP-binding protein